MKMDQGAQATPNEVTRLLIEWEHGNKAALDQLMPLVYDELRRLAAPDRDEVLERDRDPQ